MAMLMDIDDGDDREREDVIEDVLTSMWRCVIILTYVQCTCTVFNY